MYLNVGCLAGYQDDERFTGIKAIIPSVQDASRCGKLCNQTYKCMSYEYYPSEQICSLGYTSEPTNGSIQAQQVTHCKAEKPIGMLICALCDSLNNTLVKSALGFTTSLCHGCYSH